jgi:hypothetical protein
MELNTEKFIASHGHAPRGRGTWAFRVSGAIDCGVFLTSVVVAIGTLSEAKKEALRVFKASSNKIKRITEIVVLP